MGNHDYMSFNKGIISVNCMSVPDKGFIDATMTKDIAKIKFLSQKDKQSMQDYVPGGPDVIVNHVTGEVEYITRKELTKRYIHASGNKIRIAVLKNDKWYIVYAPCNIQYKIMKLPNNCSAMLPDGSPAKRGSYIVCRQDGNGQVLRQTMKDMSPKMFKKMFRIPMQPAIKRAMNNKNHSKQFTLFNANNTTSMGRMRSVTPRFDSSEINMNPSNINVPTVNEQEIASRLGHMGKALNSERPTFTPKMNTQNNNTKTFKPSFDRIKTANDEEKSKYPFTVVNRITDMDGALIGYVLMEVKTQRKKNIKPNDLAKFCAAKAVDNVMLVTREDGVQFLKGNGIRLENLPAVLL